MGRALPYVQAAFASMLLSSMAMGQTPYPDHVEQGETWSNGVHHVAVTQKILSAGDAHEDMLITGTADAEFVSGTSIHLTPDFHVGAFSGNGHFHAHIDQGLGPDGEVVLVAPDPATAVTGNVLHVPKWEKLEVGLRLPQEYQDAIDRFFTHYYGDPNNPYVATPGNVDPAHDLNPYADDSLQLVMTLTRPDGTQTLKWGYFMREGKWQGTDTTSLPIEDPDNPLDPYHIRFRLAPDMEGPWQFTLSLKAPFTTTASGAGLPQALYTGYAFACDPPLPDNHGPLHVNTANRRTLKFEDGTPYVGLGTNLEFTGYGLGWWDSNDYRLVYFNFLKVTEAMRLLHGVGGNFTRMFMMNKSLAPENSSLGVYDKFNDPVDCNRITEEKGSGQRNSWVMDMLADSARKYGIQIQLCIMPYPPIIAYESWGWQNDPYLHQFVAPRDPVTGLYDMKRYFFSNGDPATANDPGSAFYYWKRRYKYIMARWGYSVNIPIIEPFNEIDQVLTYRSVDMTDPHNAGNCPENNLNWPADPALPGTINQWVSDIAQFVRGGVDPASPATSPLGYDKKLFLMSYAMSDPNMAGGSNFYAPFLNPAVDLIDAHRGMWWGEGELSNSFNDSQQFRDGYTSTTGGTTYKKPFHQGESNYYQRVDIATYEGSDTVPNVKEAADYFDNYDVSFHNELWAGAFFGNFATLTTWHKDRVFWWGTPLPPQETFTQNPSGFIHTNVLNAFNTLNPNYIQVQVQNRTVYHNFKPLADLLSNADWQAYNFFDDAFDAHKVYDDAGGIEAYYLTSASQPLAIGWVHNLNAYWEKHYYVKNDSAMQNFFGCTVPSTQQVTLTGLPSGVDYHITWFSTRMNDTIHPADAIDTSQTGTVLLDLASAPLGDTANLYLDTLHADYAFIISPQPVHRNMQVAGGSDEPDVRASDWGYRLYPNPTRDRLNIVLPNDEPVDIALYDLSGRWLRGWSRMKGPWIPLPIDRLAQGAYYVRVSAGEHSQVKPLIIR